MHCVVSYRRLAAADTWFNVRNITNKLNDSAWINFECCAFSSHREREPADRRMNDKQQIDANIHQLSLSLFRARRYLVFLFLAVSRFICSVENWFLNRNLSCTNQTYINISNLQYAMTMAMATAINITATVYTYVRQSGRTKQKYTHRNRINYNNRIDSEKFFVVVVVVADFTWIINFYRFSRSLSFSVVIASPLLSH